MLLRGTIKQVTVRYDSHRKLQSFRQGISSTRGDALVNRRRSLSSELSSLSISSQGLASCLRSLGLSAGIAVRMPAVPFPGARDNSLQVGEFWLPLQFLADSLGTG